MLDDYSRYILAWKLCPGKQAMDMERTMQAALKTSSLTADQRPRMLSDNASTYVSRYLKEYLKQESMEHIRSVPLDPMTQGKSSPNGRPSRHRARKNVLLPAPY